MSVSAARSILLRREPQPLAVGECASLLGVSEGARSPLSLGFPKGICSPLVVVVVKAATTKSACGALATPPFTHQSQRDNGSLRDDRH